MAADEVANAGAARAVGERGRALRIVVAYASALVQGVVLVTIPASSVWLRERIGIDEGTYGSSFLLLAGAAVGASYVSARLAPRLDTARLWRAGLALGALAMGLLAITSRVPVGARVGLFLAAQATLGAGFSWTVTGINAAATALFPSTEESPSRADSAITALHALLGIGCALSPLWVSLWTRRDGWAFAPTSVVLVLASLGVAEWIADRGLPEAAPASAMTGASRSGARIRLYAVMVVAYAIAEGVFGNWAKPFLIEVHRLSDERAGLGLSGFWFSVTAGRLLTTLVVRWVAPRVVQQLLASAMAVAFVVLPWAGGPLLGVAGFCFAGLACSAVFPLSVSLATGEDPTRAAQASSVLVAALMIGNGVGTFAIAPLKALVPLATLYPLAAALPMVIVALSVVLRRSARAPWPK
jgi:MFS transporter, FHS family, glucose/mannose:H+ symporter